MIDMSTKRIKEDKQFQTFKPWIIGHIEKHPSAQPYADEIIEFCFGFILSISCRLQCSQLEETDEH